MLQPIVIRWLSVLVFLFSGFAFAQPQVGRDAAREYFAPRGPSQIPSFRLLWLHIGGYTEDESFYWGDSSPNKSVGASTYGVTYRIGEWTNSMDLHMRIDFNRYKIDGEEPLKMSFMPLVTFPDAASGFPLYFGAGAGMGVFFSQLEDESDVSFDYQLIAGLRFFNLFGETGLFIEGGMKNHLHLLSNGQFNGVFMAGGAVFTF